MGKGEGDDYAMTRLPFARGEEVGGRGRMRDRSPPIGRTGVDPCQRNAYSTSNSGEKGHSPNSTQVVLSSRCTSLIKFLFLRGVHLGRHRPLFFIAVPIAAPSRHLVLHCLLSTLLLVCFAGGAVSQGTSTDIYYHHGGDEGVRGITCYTCVNVSNNDECNRFAIDRPCPEGGDYCLTLHVMDAVDRELSVLVNKRCASLDDCSGEATGCTTASHGQTQCVSCCDQPYCNDFVPSNITNAVFYRSAARAMVAEKRQWDIVWMVATVFVTTVFNVFMIGGHS